MPRRHPPITSLHHMKDGHAQLNATRTTCTSCRYAIFVQRIRHYAAQRLYLARDFERVSAVQQALAEPCVDA